MKTILGVNFTKFNTNKKDETVLEFQVRGDLSDEQILALHKLKAAGQVTLGVGSSQMDIDDIRSAVQHEGIRGTIDKDGSVNVDDGGRQLTLEEAAAAEEHEDVSLPGLEEDSESEAEASEEQPADDEAETDDGEHEDSAEDEHGDDEDPLGDLEE
ncbi:hypothetical protein [Paenibacillus sp. CF384]|uniref:hypothetical protein n=1 Tax=Paenibacillus sp. CF384 TaxID=1884382 RepID=UPI00089C5B6A|nr:hypothetical protein [Paenibacillus sp. CF384]SDW79634.1 hypothetical protein SAMN05518855_1005142 [Paenibacillus sp. CF384]